MKKLIEQFTIQLQEAIHIGASFSLDSHKKNYRQLYICGLGGSGIGGSIIQDYVYDKINIPCSVSKEYRIAKSVNAHTLFIACSYSGNTEETIMALQQAIKAKAQTVCISSGGKLLEIAKKNKIPFIQIPGGMPPRACIGYSITQLLYILKVAGLLSISVKNEITKCIQQIDKNTKQMQTEAKKIAKLLYQQRIGLYTIAGYEGLAIRAKQQLQENSKVLCWHNVIPEMTHNEILGWRSEHRDTCILFIYPENIYIQNAKRLKVMKDIVKKYKAKTIDISLKGESYWQQVFNFIHLSDWVSVYLADLNKQDANDIDIINKLKKYVGEK
ncbi:MAG: bifunctional phosphoglucose/phosphomannose isomerase [Chitinophagaceae bacterium]